MMNELLMHPGLWLVAAGLLRAKAGEAKAGEAKVNDTAAEAAESAGVAPARAVA